MILGLLVILLCVCPVILKRHIQNLRDERDALKADLDFIREANRP